MADGTAIFSCIGGRRVLCNACGKRAIARCGFALGGRKAGMCCDAPLCPRCLHGTAERPRCRAHHYIEQRHGAERTP